MRAAAEAAAARAAKAQPSGTLMTPAGETAATAAGEAAGEAAAAEAAGEAAGEAAMVQAQSSPRKWYGWAAEDGPSTTYCLLLSPEL